MNFPNHHPETVRSNRAKLVSVLNQLADLRREWAATADDNYRALDRISHRAEALDIRRMDLCHKLPHDVVMQVEAWERQIGRAR